MHYNQHPAVVIALNAGDWFAPGAVYVKLQVAGMFPSTITVSTLPATAPPLATS